MSGEQNVQQTSENYRTYIGPIERYDFLGASQFRLLTTLGLQRHHKLLDFGCGSLRAGKLFIPYLDSGNYFGQDPNQWLIEEGIKNELGTDIVTVKNPQFSNRSDFTVGFETAFDFIIAQSIFSHTDLALTKKGINALAASLAEGGVAAINLIVGEDYQGDEEWVYPGVTEHHPDTVANILYEAQLHWRRLWWFHPKQTWFVLTKDPKRLPSAIDNFLVMGGETLRSSDMEASNCVVNRLRALSSPDYLVAKELDALVSEVAALVSNGFKRNDSSGLTDSDADTLRDLALKIEAEKPLPLEAAHYLMSLAKRTRPHGPTITKKLREYEARLKK